MRHVNVVPVPWIALDEEFRHFLHLGEFQQLTPSVLSDLKPEIPGDIAQH